VGKLVRKTRAGMMRIPPPIPNIPDSTPAARPMHRKINGMSQTLLG